MDRKQPTAQSRKIRNYRFSHNNFYDDDDDDFMGRPIESEIPVQVKVRPEFGVGGARGKLLLLQSCRKKGSFIQSNDEISTFLALLEKQQQEQSFIDTTCSTTEKRHGVGYMGQKSVVRPKASSWLTNEDHLQEEGEGEPVEEYLREVMESCSSSSSSSSNDESPKTKPLHKFRATVMNWADHEPCSRLTTLDQSLVFGIFHKKNNTEQEEQQFPLLCVPPDFNPHHVFTREEEDHLDEILVSFKNDINTNATNVAPATAMNNRSYINYRVNTPDTTLPSLPLNNESPTSSAVKDDLALALNQRFSSSNAATSTTVTQPEKNATINPSSSPWFWKRKIISFQPTHLLCKRFLLPAPLPIDNNKSVLTKAVHTSNQKHFTFPTTSSTAKMTWNYDNEKGPIPMSNAPTHVNVYRNIYTPEPADASITFLKSIFEPSNDDVGHNGGGRAKQIDSKQTNFYPDRWKKQTDYRFVNLQQNQLSQNEFQHTKLKIDPDSSIMSNSSIKKPLDAQGDNFLRMEKENLENSLQERIRQSSSSRVDQSTTNNSGKDISTHTTSSSSSNDIRKDMKRKRRKRRRKESSESCSSCSSSSSSIRKRNRRGKRRRKRERAKALVKSKKNGERDSTRKKKKHTRKK